MSESSIPSISRRNALRGAAVATAASFAAPGLASATGLFATDARLNTFRGRYALPGGETIQGYFVAPRGRTEMDTVVVLHGEQGLDARAEAVANYFAASGKLVVVPDMTRSASREAAIAKVQALGPNFGKRGLANGKVEFVNA